MAERIPHHWITVFAARMGAKWALYKEKRRRKMRRRNIAWAGKES